MKDFKEGVEEAVFNFEVGGYANIVRRAGLEGFSGINQFKIFDIKGDRLIDSRGKEIRKNRCEPYFLALNATPSFTQKESKTWKEPVHHPEYYGGKDNPYEPIKVIEAWELGFHLGNTVKYIARAGKKTPCPIEDLEKAAKYLERKIENLKKTKELREGNK